MMASLELMEEVLKHMKKILKGQVMSLIGWRNIVVRNNPHRLVITFT